MLVLGPNWTTWHLVVSQQSCEISHKMHSGMWQMISKADFLFSSHEWLSSILSCGKHGTALQTGIVSGRWHSSEIFEDSKSTSVGILYIFGSHTFVPTSWTCKKQTSVSHSSTESEIFSLDAVLTHGRNSRSRSLGFGYWSTAFFFQPNTVTPSACAENGETCSVTNNQANTPSKSRFKFNTKIFSVPMSIRFRHTRKLLVLAPCFTFLKARKRWSRW